jgi:hypothetical protein
MGFAGPLNAYSNRARVFNTVFKPARARGIHPGLGPQIVIMLSQRGPAGCSKTETVPVEDTISVLHFPSNNLG